MRKIYRYILVLILLLIIFPIEINGENRGGDYDDLEQKVSRRIEHQTKLFNQSKTDELMDILEIKPGMTILDIGAGVGLYAYKFAERLKGTGRVFATDIEIDYINYIKEEAIRRGLGNLYPVLVTKDGVDEFYNKHRYDLITMFHTNTLIYNAEADYFRRMKEFLVKDGYVAVLTFKSFPLFSSDDFTDFEGLVKELLSESPESPFHKGLHRSTWKLIKKSKGNLNETLKRAIVDDFNNMLSNHLFGIDFIEGLRFKEEVSFFKEERDLAEWLLESFIKDVAAFDRDWEDLSKMPYFPLFMDAIMQFNKLLIVQRFREYLYGGYENGTYPYAHTQTEKFFTIKRILTDAGFKLENEYADLVPFESLLIFTVNSDTEKKEGSF